MAMSRWGSAETLWWATVAGLLALLAITFVASLADKRLIDGVGVWAKPMKFQLSLAIHFATLALIVGAVSENWRTGSALLAIAIASVACSAFEIVYIMVQAARQEASHFNVGTPFHSAMYTVMALGAVVIVCAAGAVGIIVALDSAGQLPDATKAAIVLGLVGGTVLTLIVAFTMGSRMSHSVGVTMLNTPVMPIAGWVMSAGDLRVPHFFATHMIQALPLAGVVASAMLSGIVATVCVFGWAIFWTVLTLWATGNCRNGPKH